MWKILTPRPLIFLLVAIACAPAPPPPDELLLFQGLNGLIAGQATRADVEAALGAAGSEEAGEGSNIVLVYPDRGIRVHLEPGGEGTVRLLELQQPFTASSPEGIQIGLEEAAARSSLAQYPAIWDDGESVFYANDGESPATLELRFASGALASLRLHPTDSPDLPLRKLVIDDFEFVRIPAVSTVMDLTLGRIDIGPVPVKISRPYFISRYETTRSQWSEQMEDWSWSKVAPRWLKGENRRLFDSLEGDHPAVNLTWLEVQDFIERLNERHAGSYHFRLPTAAEWEVAARAGTETLWCFGDDPQELHRFGNYADQTAKNLLPMASSDQNDGYLFTAPVGSFEPNAWGLYDFHGNAWEWVADWQWDKDYRESQKAQQPMVDPKGPDSGSRRSMRGGGWDQPPGWTVSSGSIGNPVDSRMAGFRLVVEVLEGES